MTPALKGADTLIGWLSITWVVDSLILPISAGTGRVLGEGPGDDGNGQ